MLSSKHCGTRLVRRQATVALIIASLAVLTGCSSSSTSSGAAGHGQLTNITISQPFASLGYAPLYLAQSMGYLKKEGINAKFVTVSSGNELAAVIGGSAQMVVTSAMHPIAALAQGEDFYSFAAINQGFSEDVLISTSAAQAAGLTPSSSVDQKIKALAGKPVGVISPTGENLEVFQYLFHYAGLPQSSFHKEVLGTPQAVLAALQNGRIVATNLGPPFPAVAVGAGYAQYLIRVPLGVIPEMKQALTEDVSTTRTYYKAHKDVVKNLTSAIGMAEAYIYAHPTQVENYLYPLYFQGEPKAAYQEAFAEQLQGKVVSTNTTITANEKNQIVQFMQVTGNPVPGNWKSVFAP